MNNQMPFFMPFNNNLPNNHQNKSIDLERIINKLNRLEKNIRILENRINKLENNKFDNNDNYYSDDPSDMYII